MEPKNHPIEKENNLPNLHEDMFHVNLPGCTEIKASSGNEEKLTRMTEVQREALVAFSFLLSVRGVYGNNRNLKSVFLKILFGWVVFTKNT